MRRVKYYVKWLHLKKQVFQRKVLSDKKLLTTDYTD